MWIILTLGSVLTQSVRNILAKNVVKDYESMTLGWLWITFTIPFAILLVAYNGFEISNPGALYPLLITRILVDCISILTYLRALLYSRLNFLTVIFSLFPIFTIFSGFLFNNQTPSLTAIIGILIIVGSSMFVIKEERGDKTQKQSNVRKGVIYCVLTMIGWSITESITANAIEHANSSTYFLLSYCGISVAYLAIITARGKLATVIRSLDRKTILFFTLFGALGAASTMFRLAALKIGLIANIQAVKQAEVVFTAIGSKVFLKESISKARYIAIAGIMVGLIVMVFA